MSYLEINYILEIAYAIQGVYDILNLKKNILIEISVVNPEIKSKKSLRVQWIYDFFQNMCHRSYVPVSIVTSGAYYFIPATGITAFCDA